MLTLFTTAKPFKGHSAIIQRNALKSWTLLHPDIEVILFGDEEGAAEVCAEFGLRHEPHVERYEGKLPYVNFLFDRAQQIARHDYLCYLNCDIILFKDFLKAFEKALAWKNRFLLVAQRWDIDVTELIDFTAADWAKNLRQLAIATGELQIAAYIDFFLFPRGLYDSIPPLIIGYAYWDHWMVWRTLSAGCPVLDASPFVVPVHQNHEYTTTPERTKGSLADAKAMRNYALGRNGQHLRTIVDSTHQMSSSGEIKRTLFRRQFQSELFLRVRQIVAEKTFRVRDRLGLRRQGSDKPHRITPTSQD